MLLQQWSCTHGILRRDPVSSVAAHLVLDQMCCWRPPPLNPKLRFPTKNFHSHSDMRNRHESSRTSMDRQWRHLDYPKLLWLTKNFDSSLQCLRLSSLVPRIAACQCHSSTPNPVDSWSLKKSSSPLLPMKPAATCFCFEIASGLVTKCPSVCQSFARLPSWSRHPWGRSCPSPAILL